MKKLANTLILTIALSTIVAAFSNGANSLKPTRTNVIVADSEGHGGGKGSRCDSEGHGGGKGPHKLTVDA